MPDQHTVSLPGSIHGLFEPDRGVSSV